MLLYQNENTPEKMSERKKGNRIIIRNTRLTHTALNCFSVIKTTTVTSKRIENNKPNEITIPCKIDITPIRIVYVKVMTCSQLVKSTKNCPNLSF
jgi:hypothetical protein